MTTRHTTQPSPAQVKETARKANVARAGSRTSGNGKPISGRTLDSSTGLPARTSRPKRKPAR